MNEVHKQEGQIVKDIDAGDLLAELDAVEEQRPTMPEHDVAEMQIAVAAPHPPHGPAAIEQTAQPFQPAQRLALQRCGRLGRKQRGPCREVGIVLLDQALDGFCAAERLSQNRCFAMISEHRVA